MAKPELSIMKHVKAAYAWAIYLKTKMELSKPRLNHVSFQQFTTSHLFYFMAIKQVL